MVRPGCELVVCQDAANGLSCHGLDDPLVFQGSGQFETAPLGEGAAAEIWTLAGQLDQMHGYFGGKKPAGGHAPVDQQGSQCVG